MNKYRTASQTIQYLKRVNYEFLVNVNWCLVETKRVLYLAPEAIE